MKENRRLKKEKGFTLVELIVVLVILAILAAILVPALLGYIDRAKEKKELLHAKNCMTMLQADMTELYAIGGDSLTPGRNAASTIIGADNVKNNGVYSSNGNVNATDKTWAMRFLMALDLKNGLEANVSSDPYCIMFGVGSNVNKDTKADKHDKYTIYFLFYMEKADSTPLWFFNGTWRTTRPTTDEIDANNVIQVGEKKGMKLQYYVVSNKTNKYPAGDTNFMKWYNSLK